MRLSNNLSISTWSDEICSNFNKNYSIAHHKLHVADKFSKGAIVDLLDNLPKEQIQCYTMIADATETGSVVAVNPDYSCGLELYEAAEKGLFWFNLKKLEMFDSSFQELLNEMFSQLLDRGAPLKGLHEVSCDLIITSPGAHTHYHFDREPNSLWHLHGTKRLWVYPPMDFHYVTQDAIESVYSGNQTEYLPYNESFDRGSISTLLQPGDAVWWSMSSPHRVENNEMCISLNCSYKTRASVRRWNIQRANYFMLRRLGIKNRSISDEGLSSDMKEFMYRISNRLFDYKTGVNVRSGLASSLKVDASMPNCIAELDRLDMPAFLR